MVTTILNGADAMRDASEKYLPKYEKETREDYKIRVKHAKFTNIYRDIAENLAAKPFAREITLVDNSSSPAIDALIENIDGEGNHFNSFARDLFFSGINNAVDWILVDYTKLDAPAASLAEEKLMGARPYWVHIPGPSMFAVYTGQTSQGSEIVHARIHEPQVMREGFEEKTVNRIRVLNREPLENGGYADATWEVWEEVQVKGQTQPEWERVEGPSPITLGIIPLVPFVTGMRQGSSWRVTPPLRDCAFLQVEHYQQESGLKYAKELTAFPMLAANGINLYDDKGNIRQIPVGPKSVLSAPPNADGNHGEWKFIEPNATSLRFLADDIESTAQELRELGRQPLTAQTSNLTVVTTAFAAQKGNSAMQAWALNLKDALENALLLTAKWLKEDTQPEVNISTDFDLGFGDDKSFDQVLAMRAAGDLSAQTLYEEAKRRNILGPEFDAETETDRIIEDMPGDPTATDVGAALGTQTQAA